MARAQGAVGIGPVRELAELKPAIERGIQEVEKGAVCVVDVRVKPGYDAPVSGTGATARRG
jgi:hypothetical protein